MRLEVEFAIGARDAGNDKWNDPEMNRDEPSPTNIIQLVVSFIREPYKHHPTGGFLCKGTPKRFTPTHFLLSISKLLRATQSRRFSLRHQSFQSRAGFSVQRPLELAYVKLALRKVLPPATLMLGVRESEGFDSHPEIRA